MNQLSLPYRVDENREVASFHVNLEDFIRSPLQYASEMKTAVTDLAMTDRALFPNAPKEPEKALEGIANIPNDETITFQMTVDDDFRKHEIVKGVVVPQTHIFTLQLPDLTEAQRELLANIYFLQHKRIPQTITLPMPSPKPNPAQPYTTGLSWKGKCNPHTTKPNDLLKLWESDYSAAFERINAQTDGKPEN